MKVTDILPGAGTTYSYNDYKKLVIAYSENGFTSGEEQLPERIEATKINAQRMYRIDKQIKLTVGIEQAVKKIRGKWIWVILAESWCGDGAQNIPIIAKIAKESFNISLKIILRDENPQIMDKYLTNNSRAIPKLICYNSVTGNEIGTWGPRPAKIQEMVKKYKTEYPDRSHDDFVRKLHLWYALDKGDSLQKEFVRLLHQWNTRAGIVKKSDSKYRGHKNAKAANKRNDD